jgi:hypothetical protein
MKSIAILTVAAAAVVLTAPSARANGPVLKVTVPFDFVIANQTFPSGEYRLVQELDSRLLRIYSKTGRPLAITTWRPADTTTQDRGTIVFHRYGDRRFLRTIHPTAGAGACLSETVAERQARASGTSTQVALLQ